MTADRLTTVVQHLHQLADPPDEPWTDTQLLERFAHHDCRALEHLVRRHGPLVWRVCRRVLPQLDRAEDAFQATFLVLAQKAASIRKPGSVASWLHGVAYRIAQRARRDLDQHKGCPDPPEPATTADPAQQVAWRELGTIVEDEVARLPEKLRLPILLCYWEGLTNNEAAHQLGCSAGTVKSRLATARQKLHDRLLRRGVTLPAGVVAVLLHPPGAEAVLPAVLAAATVRAIHATTSAGVGAASGVAVALAKGALRGMPVSRLKVCACLALVMAGITACFAAISWPALPEGSMAMNRPTGKVQPVLTAGPLDPGGTKQLPTDRWGDPLPPEVLMRLGTVRFRHQSAVVKVTFSPDGQTLASAGADWVRLWEVSTGKQLRHFPGGSGISNHPWFGGRLTFSPDGKTIALARYRLHIWDIASGKEIQHVNLRPEAQPFPAFMSVHFTDGGKILVTSREERSFQLLDARTGKELFRFDNRGQVEYFCLSPDGRTLVHSERDNQGKETVHFWEVTTGQARRPPEVVKWLQSAEFAPDNKSLAIAADDQLRLLEWPSGKELHRWKGWSGALAFSADGKTLAAGSNQTIHLWNTATGAKLRSFPCFQWIQSLAFAPDGKTLAVGSGSYMHRLHPLDDQCGGVIHLWDTATGQRLGPQEAHQDVVTSVAYAPDGKVVASGSRDRTVRLWEPTTGKQIAVLAGHADAVLAVAFDAKGILASASRDKTVRLWDPTTRQTIRELKHDHDVYGLAFAPGGVTLATADCTTVRLWDVQTGKELRHWKGGKFGGVYSVAFSADGKTLAWSGGQRVFLPDSGGNDIHLVDPSTGQEKGLLPAKQIASFAACSLAFSPDGKLLAAGFMNPHLCLWHPTTGKLLHNIETRAEGTVAFSHDGKTLVSTGPLSSSIHFFEPAKGQEFREIVSPQGAVYAVAFAPDGRTLASAGQDGTILIWNLGPAAKGGGKEAPKKQ